MATDKKTHLDYVVPVDSSLPDEKLAWVTMVTKQGMEFLTNQKGYSDLVQARRVIEGTLDEKIPESLSTLNVNRPKRQVREIVSILASLQPRFDFKTLNKSWYQQASLMTKLAHSWWSNTFADRRLKEGLQYAATDGQGWAMLVWDSNFWGPGRGDIRMSGLGADEVIPYQIGDDHDIQRAYAVTITKSVPIAHAHAMFPEKADLIVPDSETAAHVQRGTTNVQKFASPVLSAFGIGGGRNKNSSGGAWSMVTVNYTYVKDPEINQKAEGYMMGRKGSSWEYKVYGTKDSVFDGYDEKGEKKYRRSNEEDRRKYPFRRLIISTPTVVLRDGSSPFWHGQVPVIPLYFDKWPWEYLPFSMVRDVQSLAATNNDLRRSMADSARVRLRPPLQFDDRIISEGLMRKLDTRKEAQIVGVDMTMGDGIKPILDPSFFDTPQWISQFISDNDAAADHLLGVQDFGALARAKQLPAGDSVEQLLKAVGPLVEDMTRGMEQSLREIGEQWKALAMQFYNKPRVIQLVGKDNDAATDLDFDPMSLIPSHLSTERRMDQAGNPEKSNHTLAERARKHIHTFYMYVHPNSLHRINQMSHKLTVLQLWRSGFPVDPWTVAEQLELRDFGPAPAGTTTTYERWTAWQRIKQEQAMEAAKTLAAFQAEMGMAAGGEVPGDAGAGSGVPAGGGSGAGGQAGPGRPPSAQKPPEINAKGDGRPVISES